MASYQISLVVCLSVLLFASVAESAGGSKEWTYHGELGPDHWSTDYADCDGSSQSPIDIDDDALLITEYEPWLMESFDTNTLAETEIINNGHTVQINVDGDFKTSGGGLPKKYKVLQIHFHWGTDNNQGSEHVKNGAAYPMEMHIVHWNSQDHGIVFEAVEAAEGLAVLGVWIGVGEENPAFNAILDELENIKYADQKVGLTTQFMLKDLLPENLDRFYRYNGSLTTPGCYESVVWTLFHEHIELSQAQIDQFREVFHNTAPPDPLPENYTMHEPEPIGENFRPIQDVNSRSVYTSFDAGMSPTMESTTAGTVRNIPSFLCALVLSFLYFVLRSC